MSKPWRYGDMIRKKAAPAHTAMFLGYDGGTSKFWVIILYEGSYRFGSIVRWVIGPQYWEPVDE